MRNVELAHNSCFGKRLYKLSATFNKDYDFSDLEIKPVELYIGSNLVSTQIKA